MILTMEDTAKIFVAGLKKWAKINKVSQTTLGNVIDRHQSSVSAYYKNESRPTHDMIKKWTEHFNLDYDEILRTGRDELNLETPLIKQIVLDVMEANKQETISLEEKRNARHHGIIDRFINHNLATAINESLVLLEKLDPDEMEEIKIIIDHKIKKLQKKKGRTIDDPNQKAAGGT